MDPNFLIAFIFTLIILLILTIINFGALVKKILDASFSTLFKICFILFLIGLLATGVIFSLKGNFVIGTITVFLSSFIIGLNWSINLSKKYSARFEGRYELIKTGSLVLFFTILLPAIVYFLMILFDKLDLFPSE